MTSLIDILGENPASGFAAEMSRTPQPIQWHGEGDVMTHTEMVVQALRDIPEVEDLSPLERDLLYTAAWLHDIGKIRQTRDIGGRIEAPSHAPVGSRMARRELWQTHGICGTPELIQMREAIALLIHYHSLPPYIIDSSSAEVRLHKIAANSLLTPYFSIKLLCLLSRADMMGRISPDTTQMLDRIALCEELAKEENCFEACYPFPSDLTRHAYINDHKIWKDMVMHDNSWGEIIVMCGLPGTGKDTWIQNNLQDLPMVSLDEIRRIRKISPLEDQGLVANLAKQQAQEYLRKRQPFVWNATNIIDSTRSRIVGLCESYGAHVRLIYLETDWNTLSQRNASRADAVPEQVIRSMLGKLTPPAIHEARFVEWISV